MINPDAQRKASKVYIPRAELFKPSDVMAVKISPDSNYLAYVKAKPSGVMVPDLTY